jgi:hypothetical protein
MSDGRRRRYDYAVASLQPEERIEGEPDCNERYTGELESFVPGAASAGASAAKAPADAH